MMGSKLRMFTTLGGRTLEALVPADNLYRRLQRVLDLSFVHELVDDCYAAGGRPSVDPEVFFKLQLATIPRAYYVSARRVAKERYGGLTQREREVVARIAAGKMNREIAGDLFVSEKTIELHVSNSLRKLGCRTRTELAAWAVASGLIGADADDDRPENLVKSL